MLDAAEREKSYGNFAAVFPSVMLPMFLAVADQTIVAAALPAIASDLGSVERVSWVVIAYLVSTTIAAPIYGQLRDVLGSRSMMLLALAVFMGASILCALSVSLEMLAFCRVLQGLGGGGLMTISQALIGESVAPRERAKYQGWLAGIAVTASTAGPVIGGIMAEHIGWRSIFLVNIPLGLIATMLILRTASRPPPTQPWRLDSLGIAYFVGFIVPLLLGVELAQRMTPQALLGALALAAMGGGFLYLLLKQEEQAPTPLLNLELLRRPAIWRSGVMTACHGAALVSLVTWLPVYFRVMFGTSAAESGALMLPLMIGIGSGSMITGQLVSRTGVTMIFPTVGIAVAIVLIQFFGLWAARLSPTFIVSLLLLIGLFMGTVMAVIQVTVQRVAGKGLLGAAAATIQFSRSVGAALGTAIVGAILFATLGFSDPEALRIFKAAVQEGSSAFGTLSSQQQMLIRAEMGHAFGVAFSSITIFLIVALGLAWSHPERRL